MTTTTAKVHRRSWEPMPAVLDGDPIVIEVKRLDLDAFTLLEAQLEHFERSDPDLVTLTEEEAGACATPAERAERLLAKNAEVDARRTPEERAALERRRRARIEALRAFISESIRAYVRLPEGELAVDGVPVRTGEELLRHFGSRFPEMLLLVELVKVANTLTAEQRKNFASRVGSSTTSDARHQAPAGPSPAPTADAAAPSTSVEIAAATPAPTSAG